MDWVTRVIKLKANKDVNISPDVRTPAYFQAVANEEILKVECHVDGYVSLKDNTHLSHFVELSINDFDSQYHLFTPSMYTTILEKPLGD